MWRRSGESVFGALVLLVLVVEAALLAFLTRGFALRLIGAIPSLRLEATVSWAVSTTALLLVVLVVYVIGYHHLSGIWQRRDLGQLQAWGETWVKVLHGDAPLPQGPLSGPAEEALLALREILHGDEGILLQDMLRDTGLAADLVKRLTSRFLVRRLVALEGLARARLLEAVDPLFVSLDGKEPAVRLLAARAIARTLGGLALGEPDEGRTLRFAASLRRAELPKGVVDEVLLLLEGRAKHLIRDLLRDPPASAALRRAALEALGRLALLDMLPIAAPALTDSDGEVRAAALRAILRIGYIPPDLLPRVAALLRDPLEFVRLHAARAINLVPGKTALDALVECLGDSSWYVRRSAAEALALRGPDGDAVLEEMSRTHEDRFARDMAAQVRADARAQAADRLSGGVRR
jgi:HEAT repeat protein